MSGIESSEIPLPSNWTIRLTEDGKKVFVDHANKITTWIDPRDSLTKPHTFADCIGNELPYGWDVAYDENIGRYFINHNDGSNQLEDPRLQWRILQESMIRDYLKSAHENISAKESILKLKHERLTLAEQELSHLNDILQRINEKQQQHIQLAVFNACGSKSSLASSSSSLSSKYDPDLLRAEIETARQRVAKLKMEEHYARHELRDKQRGIKTLTEIEQKIVDKPEGYSICERNAIENELVNLKRTLTSNDKEKLNLLRALAILREDIQGKQRSTELANMFMPTEKATSSSQTDVIDSVNGNRVAVLARARLQYNELKIVLNNLQEQLSTLNDRMLPSQLELDRDQLNLIREKENLLRELKIVCQSDAPFDQQAKLREKMHELEDDLRRALRLTHEEMTQRLHLHQQKANLETQIHETGLALANLELQLRSLSASTLSTSSLSTNSSRGSLASGSAQDLLYMTNVAGEWSPRAVVAELKDVHRRVEQLVYSDHQNHNLDNNNYFLPPSAPPPLYDVTKSAPNVVDPSSLIMRLANVSNHELPIKSSNTASSDVVLLRESSASSGTNTRSVSAAVSDESVAGDSGVYDGNQRFAQNAPAVLTPAVAQLMVTLNYTASVNKLSVTLEKARNLSTLWRLPKSFSAVQIRGCLLPTAPGEEFTFRTDWSAETDKPVFKNTFELDINLHRICNKILQLYVWGKHNIAANSAANAAAPELSAAAADCLGGSQINLAEFNTRMMRSQWANVLSSQFIKLPPSERPVSHNQPQQQHNETSIETVEHHRRDNSQWKTQNAGQPARQLNTLKEESSDESTVISSRTSTLTRSQNQAPIEESTLEQQSNDIDDNTGFSNGKYLLRVTVNDCTSEEEEEEEEEFDDEDIASEELVRVGPAAVQVETCDKGINTDPVETSGVSSTVSKCSSNSNLRVRRLNRSDSDSSVALQRKEPFRRNVIERRSLRWKRLGQSSSQHRHAASAIDPQDPQAAFRARIEHRDQFRTSVDIDLDLHTTKLRLERQAEEIETLKKIKSELEEWKASGQSDLPKWLIDNDGLMKAMNASGQPRGEYSNMVENISSKETEEKRARHIVRKSAHHVQKLKEVKLQQPSTSGFRKKISSLVWTSPTVVNVINVNDNDTLNEAT